jgi:hypothetical protein
MHQSVKLPKKKLEAAIGKKIPAEAFRDIKRSIVWYAMFALSGPLPPQRKLVKNLEGLCKSISSVRSLVTDEAEPVLPAEAAFNGKVTFDEELRLLHVLEKIVADLGYVAKTSEIIAAPKGFLPASVPPPFHEMLLFKLEALLDALLLVSQWIIQDLGPAGKSRGPKEFSWPVWAWMVSKIAKTNGLPYRVSKGDIGATSPFVVFFIELQKCLPEAIRMHTQSPGALAQAIYRARSERADASVEELLRVVDAADDAFP